MGRPGYLAASRPSGGAQTLDASPTAIPVLGVRYGLPTVEQWMAKECKMGRGTMPVGRSTPINRAEIEQGGNVVHNPGPTRGNKRSLGQRQRDGRKCSNETAQNRNSRYIKGIHERALLNMILDGACPFATPKAEAAAEEAETDTDGDEEITISHPQVHSSSAPDKMPEILQQMIALTALVQN